MLTLKRLMPAVVLALIATSFPLGSGVAEAAVGLPLYRVDAVVPNGVATAINNLGDIVGWQTVNGSPRAFIFSAGSLTLLPNPAGRPLSIARDINDARIIVGHAYKTTIDEPGNSMRWVRGPSGWVVKDLGFLAGDLVSEATGLNESGRIVGHSNPRSFLSEHGFLHTTAAGMTALGAANSSYVPYDINEKGVTVGTGYSTAQRVDSVTGVSQNLGTRAPYGLSHAYALNDAGQVAGTLTSSSGNGQVVARYSDATGWQVLGGLGGGGGYKIQNIGWGINSAGTVVGVGWPRTGETPSKRAVIYLDAAARLLYVDDLLQSGGSWTILSAYDINDAGQIAAYARNRLTGKTAAVRLTRVGTLPIPSAPSLLTAMPHAAVTSQDENRIDLRWVDNSPYETAFQVDRRQVDAVGTPLTPYARLMTTGPNITRYSDVDLLPGAYYQYVVRAVGFAGISADSNRPIARAPSTIPETTAPAVSITSPASMSTVSGIVPVRISARVNVAVTQVELIVDTELGGQCTLGTATVYTCQWDTRNWSDGGWTLYARAWDQAGNLGVHAITVFVRNGP